AFARAPDVLEKAAMRLAEVAPAWQSLVEEAQATAALPAPAVEAKATVALPAPVAPAKTGPEVSTADLALAPGGKSKREGLPAEAPGGDKRPRVQTGPIPTTSGYMDSDSESPPWSPELAALLVAWGRCKTRAAARAWAAYAPRLASGVKEQLGFKPAEYKKHVEMVPAEVREALDVRVRAERSRPPRRVDELTAAYFGIFAAAEQYWAAHGAAPDET
ncbi:unnamed protein product, partial [Effrenium voratum]